MNTPQFITFTGADDLTDIEAMKALSADYPVEFGILFSPTKGERRYPRFPHRFKRNGLRLAMHLCGEDALNCLLDQGRQADFEGFGRVQFNISEVVSRGTYLEILKDWTSGLGVEAILQCRTEFGQRHEGNVSWVFDQSGGRGKPPASWPPLPDCIESSLPPKFGYAGGLGPDSDFTTIALAAGRMPYWIDMESGVRDANDVFDLGKCRLVCEKVYG